jgi:hypothetical protein
MKSLYILQPYHVGSKNARSLALVIPSEVKRECDIDTSTAFALFVDKVTKGVTLRTIAVNNILNSKNMMMPIGESFQASTQQASSADVQ